jgi:hypothetical protein
LEVAAILARNGRSMKKIEEGVVSNRSLDPILGFFARPLELVQQGGIPRLSS